MIAPRKPLFELGQIVATPNAIDALEEAGQQPTEFLRRHVSGDWGQLEKHDRQANNDAVESGDRILSSYLLKSGSKIWAITEADRSSTCLLLPEDY
mgnify:CR=1 FL=1